MLRNLPLFGPPGRSPAATIVASQCRGHANQTATSTSSHASTISQVAVTLSGEPRRPTAMAVMVVVTMKMVMTSACVVSSCCSGSSNPA